VDGIIISYRQKNEGRKKGRKEGRKEGTACTGVNWLCADANGGLMEQENEDWPSRTRGNLLTCTATVSFLRAFCYVNVS
jgi:hypothetical protein